MTGNNKKQTPIELGAGGIKIIQDGVHTLAEDCTRTDTQAPVTIIELTKIFDRWRKLARLNDDVSSDALKARFQHEPIAPANEPVGRALDANDWSALAETFADRGKNHATAKGAAYAFVKRKTALEYPTLKTLKSRFKKKSR